MNFDSIHFISFLESSSTYTFTETVADIPVTFYIIKMKSCLFVWIGDKGVFENLAVAMNTTYNAMPIATSVMGHLGNDDSCSLATKLSKKTGKQVFASFNLSKTENNVLLNVSQILMEKIKNHPDKF